MMCSLVAAKFVRAIRRGGEEKRKKAGKRGYTDIHASHASFASTMSVCTKPKGFVDDTKVVMLCL